VRLATLGGSAAAPNPGEGCSGSLLETANARIVLDLGPGTFPELRRHADYRTLSAVVISHLHLDHILDLLTLRNALAYNPIPPPDRIPLWLPPGGAQFLDDLARVFAEPDDVAGYFASFFSIEEYEPSKTLPIQDLILDFAPTVHYVPCWAIRVTEPATAKTLAYTADTGPAADLDRLIEGAQVLLAEATLPTSTEESRIERGHLTARDAGLLAQRTGVEVLVLTHTFTEHGRETLTQPAAAVFDGQIVVASAGRVIEW